MKADSVEKHAPSTSLKTSVHENAQAPRAASGCIEIEGCEELEIPSQALEQEHALRLLARWLIAAARKGAPAEDSGRSTDGQNVLDVVPDAEVVSERESREMPAQQGFQRGHNR